jgi:predicted TIM-barrel fold metal-dependent hydrolase
MIHQFIVDAHVHLNPISKIFASETGVGDLLNLMDRLSIQYGVCSDHLSLYEGAGAGLRTLRNVYTTSNSRIHFLGVFDPKKSEACLKVLHDALKWPGFCGIKIHPSFHGVSADDPSYEPIWRFARANDLTILTHSWSLSDYNPAQALSTPHRFEPYIAKYPEVRLVLAHLGGRGLGRHEVIRLIHEYDNVYTDLAGDIFDLCLIESLINTIPDNRILFGSDFPWLDPRSNLARVFLADIADTSKEKILRTNAMYVYKIIQDTPQRK